MQNSSPAPFRPAQVEPMGESMPGSAIAAGVLGILSALPLAGWFGLLALFDDLSAADHLLAPIALLEFLGSILLLCGVSRLPLLLGSLFAAVADVALGIAGPPEHMYLAMGLGTAVCPSIAAVLAATPAVHSWIAARSRWSIPG